MTCINNICVKIVIYLIYENVNFLKVFFIKILK